ncbi:U-box domain-containing protein 15-like [Zingiber officinale]|uniref:DUF7032 domain-containing protein n=1 Tax=Zingiber officinale TaxID=94328 RepID=A0A8J5EV38_ZINOF|nr:U-box domain-containing protein 15-like [Zingiber officinale]KAG6474738.1 hypothetical protein ZIOFF_068677 [Zingiber officinale]
MVEESEALAGSAEQFLSSALLLLPTAIEKARSALRFAGRWKSIATKLELVAPALNDLAGHPCFSRHALCRELLQSVAATLAEAVELADRCGDPSVGKLRMQSDLDALAGKLDLNLRDCGLLVKTGVLGEAALPAASAVRPGEAESVREMLARLQFGHDEAKHRALDGLLEAMREDEKGVTAVIGRSNVAALIQLLTAASPMVREKAATAICSLVESGNWDTLLVSEGTIPPLIRLLESGSFVAREKAVLSVQKLSTSAVNSRSIAGHGGIPPLIDLCQVGDSISQSAAAAALKNLSAVPEARQTLVDEGIVRVMINVLDYGVVLGSKEQAAECLLQLTSGTEKFRQLIVSEGGIRSLLAYLDGPLPPEPAIAAVKNLVGSVSMESLISLGLLPRLTNVLKTGSLMAQQTAAAAVCKISGSPEIKKLVGESGCLPSLINMLEAKSNSSREIAAQAIASLIACPRNGNEIKKEDKCVPNLVQLLDPSPQNTAKKHAVACLMALSSSKKCRKVMISYGAIGYLKKLSEADVAASKKLLERLESGRLKRFLFH